MSWNYQPSLLTSNTSTQLRQVMRVRVLVGDTDSGNPQLQDEEIAYVLQNQEAINYAAADCADMLAAKYAYQVSTVNSELRVTASQRQEQFAALAKRLRASGPGNTPGGPSAGLILAEGYAGGISATENETLRSDDSYSIPPFKIGEDDHPEVQDPIVV